MSFIPRLVIRELYQAFFFVAGIYTGLVLQEWIRQPFLHRRVHKLALGFCSVDSSRNATINLLSETLFCAATEGPTLARETSTLMSKPEIRGAFINVQTTHAAMHAPDNNPNHDAEVFLPSNIPIWSDLSRSAYLLSRGFRSIARFCRTSVTFTLHSRTACITTLAKFAPWPSMQTSSFDSKIVKFCVSVPVSSEAQRLHARMYFDMRASVMTAIITFV